MQHNGWVLIAALLEIAWISSNSLPGPDLRMSATMQCNMACKALRSEFGADLPLNIQIWLSLGAWPFQLFNIGHVLVTFWTRPLVLRKFGLFVVLILPPLGEPSGRMKCVRWAATLCWQWQTNILHCVPSYASLSNIFGWNFMAALKETFGNHFKS